MRKAGCRVGVAEYDISAVDVAYLLGRDGAVLVALRQYRDIAAQRDADWRTEGLHVAYYPVRVAAYGR